MRSLLRLRRQFRQFQFSRLPVVDVRVVDQDALQESHPRSVHLLTYHNQIKADGP